MAFRAVTTEGAELERRVQAPSPGHPNPKRLARKGGTSKTDYKVTTEVGRKPEGYLEAMLRGYPGRGRAQLGQMLLIGIAR